MSLNVKIWQKLLQSEGGFVLNASSHEKGLAHSSTVEFHFYPFSHFRCKATNIYNEMLLVGRKVNIVIINDEKCQLWGWQEGKWRAAAGTLNSTERPKPWQCLNLCPSRGPLTIMLQILVVGYVWLGLTNGTATLDRHNFSIGHVFMNLANLEHQ